MLNLNAMFGPCESIFESDAPRRPISSTELQMMGMEIVTDLARTEVDTIKASTTMSQLDQLLNMYNHVKRFGIDRTFLFLYNTNNQLNNMLGVKFPSCESINAVGNANSNISRTFIVAMEDAKEGIFAKIIKGIKWVWEKIKYLCTIIWKKIKSWIGLGTKRNKAILDKAAEAVRNGVRPKSIKRIITKKRVAATVAVIAATIAAIYAYKKYGKKNTSSSENPEIKNTEANLKKAKDDLTKIKQEEKSETIENPTQPQMESIIKDAKDANTQIGKMSGTIDKVEKELETEAEKEDYSKFLPAVVGNGFSDSLPSDTRAMINESKNDYINRINKSGKDLDELYKSAAWWRWKASRTKEYLSKNQDLLKEYNSLSKLSTAQTEQLKRAKDDVEKYKEEYESDMEIVNNFVNRVNDRFAYLGRQGKHHDEFVDEVIENNSK